MLSLASLSARLSEHPHTHANTRTLWLRDVPAGTRYQVIVLNQRLKTVVTEIWYKCSVLRQKEQRAHPWADLEGIEPVLDEGLHVPWDALSRRAVVTERRAVGEAVVQVPASEDPLRSGEAVGERTVICADIPSPSRLKRLLQGEGGAAE